MLRSGRRTSIRKMTDYSAKHKKASKRDKKIPNWRISRVK